MRNGDGWKEEKDKSGVQMYSKPSGGKIDNYLRIMEVNAPIDDVIAFYSDLEAMKEIDDRIDTIAIGKLTNLLSVRVGWGSYNLFLTSYL